MRTYIILIYIHVYILRWHGGVLTRSPTGHEPRKSPGVFAYIARVGPLILPTLKRFIAACLGSLSTCERVLEELTHHVKPRRHKKKKPINPSILI